jgi:iron complex outermembrane receptor protein
MLGNTVPAARSIEPRINLNDQPWGQPVVMNGDTASLRWEQRLSEDWRFTAHAMQQQLKSDDRTAFPYGVYDTTAYDCPQWCDRYAQDGTFSYWQYVSDNERRTSQALSLVVAGQVRTAGIEHKVETGVLLSRYHGRFQDQVYDIAGTGRIDDSLQVPASPGGTDANTNRDERSTEFFLRDAIRLAPGWQLWAGLRHTRLDREAERTSTSADGGLRRTRYAQGLSTPWLAISNELSARTLVYASWGQGVESEVVPNRDRYTNRTTVLPALKSRQIEAGLKHRGEVLEATLAVFDTDRPQAADIGACSAADSCTRAIDGSARHRGVEASGSWRAAAWLWHFGTLWMDAQRRGSSQPGIDGTRPVNVPAATWRLSVEYAVPSVPGLGLLADASAESNRVVLPYDQSVKIPGWQRLDLGARWRHTLEGTTLVWRLGLDNATDQRAWKESPYQFGHVYLYPLAPRTWRASLQASF